MKTIPLLYEDDNIVIVNKQSGLAVQGGKGISHPLDDVLSGQLGYRVHLVHRLDRDTAGILVVAKNAAAAARYAEIFALGRAKKEYVAFCAGVPPKKRGEIRGSVAAKGVEKSALTMYTLLARAERESECGALCACKLALTLGTGRMHQLRIHLASVGAPIIGDDKHGNFALNRQFKKLYGAKRLLLAAVRLVLPVEAGLKTFEVGLPEHMRDFERRFFDGSGANAESLAAVSDGSTRADGAAGSADGDAR